MTGDTESSRLLNELRASEKELREQLRISRVLFDQSLIGVISFEPNGLIYSANDAAAEILAFDSQNLLVGRSMDRIFADLDNKWLADQVASLEGMLQVHVDAKSRFRKSDDSLVWVRFRLTFIPDDQGKILKLVIFFWDYSKEKEFEEKLADTKKWLEAEVGLKTLELYEKNQELDLALKKLESLNKTKTEFLRIISHEIRTPLNGLLGSVMLLKDLANTDEQKEFFELLDISIHRLESFALTAVQIAELQTLQSKLSKAPVHLNALIGEIGKVINFEQHHRKLSVKTNIGNEVIFVNRALFITALTKIFENAVRFSPMDGVITMTVTPESDGIHFVIEDEGPGFPHEVLLHKFEPFVSGDTHIDQNPAISLSMVRFIIEAHGGKIDIFNPRTGGAAVDFYLPEHG